MANTKALIVTTLLTFFDKSRLKNSMTSKTTSATMAITIVSASKPSLVIASRVPTLTTTKKRDSQNPQ